MLLRCTWMMERDALHELPHQQQLSMVDREARRVLQAMRQARRVDAFQPSLPLRDECWRVPGCDPAEIQAEANHVALAIVSVLCANGALLRVARSTAATHWMPTQFLFALPRILLQALRVQSLLLAANNQIARRFDQ